MGRTLGTLSKTDREQYLWRVFEEAERFKQPKEQEIIEVFRFLRNLKDDASPYRATLRHPYAFSAAQTIKAQIYPVIFSGDPAVQILDPNPDNRDRNQTTERILSGLIKNPMLSNFKPAFERGLDDAIWFGFSYPWTYFRSRYKRIGPRFEPRMFNQQPIFDNNGDVVLDAVYDDVRVYHAPWLEHVDVWDTFIHPDGIRGFTRRDVTGYELLAQAQGDNPIYDLSTVNGMIRQELFSRKVASDVGSYHAGTPSMQMRDQMSAEAGAEPPRHSELQSSYWEKDVLAKPYTLLHYDDGEYHGTYAVLSTGRQLRELRFFQGVNYDGSSNRMNLRTWTSPQDIYGTSWFVVSKDLLQLHSNFYRAAADAAALQVHPMYVGSQQMRMSGSDPVFGPGAVIWTPHVNRSLDEHFKRLETGGDFFNTFQLVDQIQRGLDMGLGQGDPQRGLHTGGRKTAFETQRVSQGAQNKIEVLNTKINDDFIIPLARKWTAMVAEHYTGKDYARILGVEGAGYMPPSREEIITGLQYIPKGSLTAADSQMRQARWPGIFQIALQALPYMQVPHIHELYKRVMEDMQVEAATRAIPSINDPQMTEYMELVQGAMMTAGAGGGATGQASPPSSPGDISTLLSQIGGGTAPPGPTDGGGGGVTSGIAAGNGGGGRF